MWTPTPRPKGFHAPCGDVVELISKIIMKHNYVWIFGGITLRYYIVGAQDLNDVGLVDIVKIGYHGKVICKHVQMVVCLTHD
jgi:hypothetical protein